MKQEPFLRPGDISLARAMARVGLGINICGHGVARLPHISNFVAATVKSFAPTFLPVWSVQLTSYLIPPAELAIGTCLILGLFQRPVLVLGAFLMFQLTLGTVILQEWQVAAIQLFYIAFYAVLIATLGFDSFSLDAWRRKPSA